MPQPEPFDAVPASALPDIVWPAICGGPSAAQLSVLFQLEQSQWWSPDRLRDAQMRQVKQVVDWAWAQSPFYRRVWSEAGFDPERDDLSESWSKLPIVTRAMIRSAGDDLHCKRYPKKHGKSERKQTSGSTGSPVTFYKTDVAGLFWSVFTLREHVWHRRDLSLKLCAIRTTSAGSVPPQGIVINSWGVSTAAFRTGPSGMLSIFEDLDHQCRWLVEQDPDYLLSNPTNLRALAKRFIDTGQTLPRLREVRTLGEMLPDDVRQWCRDAWGAPLVDMYSSEEIGYIALQCPHPHAPAPGSERYHVQSENTLLEVVDDDGRPCAPGEVGRIITTTLHNFATPFVRYEIGDYAEVGEPCPCGRGLPVLRRILGRQRNMITLPDGSRHWPGFHAKLWADIAPIQQLQFVQDRVDHIEARIVMDRPFTDDERRQFVDAIKERMRFPHNIDVTYVDRIERSKGGKYEDFLSLIDP